MPPKRRRKFHGLYYHSSPPKVLPMNGNSNSSKTSGRDDSKEAFVVKPSSIRIWIHDKDVGKLTRVLWAGQGNRLRTETSTNPRVRKFLETVPYVLNTIKDVHQAVVDNNLDVLKSKTEPPVPPSLITTKDSNGLTVMHKAAGLAHTRIVEYLLKVWPGGATDIDATGKTPLHWAASAKNNTRCYNLLVQAGADEEALDYRMKNAAYYKHKPHDIDRSLLTIVPEAPRVPQENHPDWSALVDEVGKLTSSQTDLSTENDNNNKEEENEPSINLLTSRSKVNTTEDTPEVDDIENGNSKLTIEEQAVMDAIEDEKIYEKQLSEKEANHEDTEDLDVDDTNGSPEVTPRNTPSPIPKDDNFDDDTDRKANDEPEVNGNDQDDQGANDNQTTNDQKDTTSSHTEDDPPKSTSGTSEDSPEVTSEAIDSKKEEKEDCQAGFTEENHETMPAEEEKEGTPKKVPVAGQESREATPQEKCDEGSPEKGPSCNGNVTDENEKTENNTEETRESGDNNKDDELKATNGNETDNPKADDDKVPEGSDNENKLSEVEDQETATNPDEANPDEDVDVKVASENEKNTRKTESAKSNTSKEENVSQTESTKSNILNEENIRKTESAKSTTSNEGSPTKPISAKSTTSNEGSPTKPISAKSTTSNGNLTNGIDKNEEIHKQQETDQNEAPRVKTPSHKNADIENNDGQKYDEDDDDQEVIRSNGSIDENHNAIKSNGQKSATPVSPALEYEGVVQGEADDNQVQSQSGGYFANEGDRIQSVIDSGDMEQLAALVLNGEGKKLLGTRSTQPEIQAFLDNVPSYMNKIRRVHQAARNGNIRDLQAALDRRKFAIAKDEISPDGATPLHVATVFGHAGIIRYLGGRFPETTSAVDDNGRTALHYAATINDNGHFYNLLVNLGSNPKSLDKMGESAEYYKDNRQESMKVFSYQKLLKAFGADENLEDEMLSDQVPDDLHSARRPVDDADVLSTLERCFRLLHEPNRQADPLGSATPSSASSLRLTVTTYLARFLKRSIFDKIKHRQTRLDHNLFDVIWPAMKKSSKERRIDEDLNAGVVAPDFDVYVVFQEFLVPLIKDIHCMPQSQDFKPHPGIFYFPVIDGKIDSSIRLSVDESRKYIVDGFVECSRNLDDFELPLNLNIGQIEQAERVILEKILSSDFADAISEEEPGTYYTMNEVLENPSEIRTVLATSKLLIALLDTSDPKQEAESLAINGQYWPYGRGVFLSSAGDLAAWINVQEHLRIIVSTPSDAPADVGYAYSKVGRAMMYLESKLHFRESYLLGYLSSRPSYLGTALKISLTMDLPNLVKELDNLRHLCVVRGLNIIPNQKDGIVRVVNMQSLGVTEWRLFQDYCTAVTNILQLEKDMALTNSKQIAAMLVKIFRRKKNSLVDS
ncbi:uncharacterized protein LOC119651140 isoform X2 [Hermetia illucens]|uniref:uncharacterized protein LOC119651140 isoform X2 n=1 Tax=Hermetia illucens TaxID=343691 RepID=UPI0018CC780C|nr:uncharacterized protein LOC119651140 isoform X2 [Hermetia illucens]